MSLNYNFELLSQNEAWNKLLSMKEALPSALLLLGPSGCGKKIAVQKLFQTFVCKNNSDSQEGSLFGNSEPMEVPCGKCFSCKHVFEGQHPDLIQIKAQGQNIRVDDLRELKKTLYFAPTDSPIRFVVIEDAHKLNASSANSILKMLEEPPAHTKFFLITHERDLLLQTILSRCQFLYFEALSDNTLQALYDKHGVKFSSAIAQYCMDYSNGGMARLPTFAVEDNLEFIEQIHKEISAWKKQPPSFDHLTKFADSLSNVDEKIELFLSSVQWLVKMWIVNGDDQDKERSYYSIFEYSTYLQRRLTENGNKKLMALSSVYNSAMNLRSS